MKTTLLELQRVHAQKRRILISKRQMEREAMAIRHHDRLQQSRLINADLIARSTALIDNAQELANFAFRYLYEWMEMEDRQAIEIAALS